MATKYFCDRCNQDSYNKMQVLEVPTDTPGGNWSVKYDLCDTCLQEVRKFLKPTDEKKN